MRFARLNVLSICKDTSFLLCYQTVLKDKCVKNNGKMEGQPEGKTKKSTKEKEKAKKVMWASIVLVKFSIKENEKKLFKYNYTEKYRRCFR